MTTRPQPSNLPADVTRGARQGTSRFRDNPGGDADADFYHADRRQKHGPGQERGHRVEGFTPGAAGDLAFKRARRGEQ